ncbi:MAG: hypothetical protein KKF12_09035 [Proteobacteria bacterium]|nr:hypothetical protein [Desulfobacula sp.]MBU3953580.1 hypothetical protein [Pseudomonadota bacterium]MBU4130951.1 hypothetical protein [Pseudomonadota bacterium]
MTINTALKITILWILFLASGFLHSDFKTFASESDIENLCSFIAVEKAAAILSLPVADLQKSHRELMVSPEDVKNKTYKQPPLSCSIRSKSNFLKMITYVIYVFNEPSHAQVELRKMKTGFETVSEVEMIKGMGEEAFWAGGKRFQRLVARKNNKMIDVLSPKEFNFQADIMQMIMDKL